MTAVVSQVTSAKRTLFVLISVVVAQSAWAQSPAPPNPYEGWDNAYYQIMADELRRVGLNRTVYSSDGHVVGRIVDVHTTPDGMHEAAVVRVRRLMGGGQVALPLNRLAKLDGRLVARDGRAAILAMDRLDVTGTGARQ